MQCLDAGELISSVQKFVLAFTHLVEGEKLDAGKPDPIQQRRNAAGVLQRVVEAGNDGYPWQNVQTLLMRPCEVFENQVIADARTVHVPLRRVVLDVKQQKIKLRRKPLENMRRDAAGCFNGGMNMVRFQLGDQFINEIRLAHPLAAGDHHTAVGFLIKVVILHTDGDHLVDRLIFALIGKGAARTCFDALEAAVALVEVDMNAPVLADADRFLRAGMQAYRESVLDKKPYVDAQRALLATEAYQANQNQPAVMKRALMLKNILEKMTIYIEDETVLVGNQASSNKDAPIFPEYTLKFVLDKLDLFEKRDGDVFYITEETKEQLRSIAPFWENNNLRAKGEALIPAEMEPYMKTGFFGMEGKLNAGDAHIAVDYAGVLKNGLKGFEHRARMYKANLDLTATDAIDKYAFYKAVLIVIDAIRKFALRYAELARQKAETAEEPRRAELLEIARVCEKVPYEPAETFHEAVQSTWFIQLILQIESNGHSLSYGRFDQYGGALFPEQALVH